MWRSPISAPFSVLCSVFVSYSRFDRKKIAEYKERHKAVWPDMLRALRETGWHNYSLFLREDGLLVGYFETPDYKEALAGMANREVNERWQKAIAPFFENLERQRLDEGFRRLEQVFHLT